MLYILIISNPGLHSYPPLTDDQGDDHKEEKLSERNYKPYPAPTPISNFDSANNLFNETSKEPSNDSSDKLTSSNDNHSDVDINTNNASGNESANNGTKHLANDNNERQLKLNEKIPMEGFKRLYTESERELSQKLKQIITNDTPYQKFIQSIPSNDYLQSAVLNDVDNSLLDEIVSDHNGPKSSQKTGPISIEQESMRKCFELLTIDQQQLLKSKLPLLSDITTRENRKELLINKLQLCATTFDFFTTVCYIILL